MDHQDVEFAAGRVYYAMFYTAEALLAEEGKRSRSHSGVHGLFGQQFAKTERLDPKYHRWMLVAFSNRLQSDYGFDVTLTVDDVQDGIDQAAEFLSTAQAFLTPESPAC